MSDRVPLSDFTPEVLFEVGDVPVEIAEDYIRKSAIELCERANVLMRNQKIPLWATVSEYVLKAPPGERVHAVTAVMPIDPCGPYTAPIDYFGQFCCSFGNITFSLPDRMFVTPAPQCDIPDGMFIRTVNVPTQDACDVDRLLFEKYHNAIRYGAIAQLLMVTSAPWYNREAAANYLQLARRAQDVAGVERVLGPVRKVHKIVPRRIV